MTRGTKARVEVAWGEQLRAWCICTLIVLHTVAAAKQHRGSHTLRVPGGSFARVKVLYYCCLQRSNASQFSVLWSTGRLHKPPQTCSGLLVEQPGLCKRAHTFFTETVRHQEPLQAEGSLACNTAEQAPSQPYREGLLTSKSSPRTTHFEEPGSGSWYHRYAAEHLPWATV
jgi:hypothetical protein